jgi:hypothetical protein
VLAITLSTACAVEGVIDVAKLTGDALNPEAHRADITAIDAILFEDGGLTADGRSELVKRLMSLSEVAAKDPSNTIALNIGKNMKRFAAGAARHAAPELADAPPVDGHAQQPLRGRCVVALELRGSY